MLDDDDEVAFRGEPVEDPEEPVDVVEAEPAGRLVEEDRDAAGARRGEKAREPEPLPLARGER